MKSVGTFIPVHVSEGTDYGSRYCYDAPKTILNRLSVRGHELSNQIGTTSTDQKNHFAARILKPS